MNDFWNAWIELWEEASGAFSQKDFTAPPADPTPWEQINKDTPSHWKQPEQ